MSCDSSAIWGKEFKIEKHNLQHSAKEKVKALVKGFQDWNCKMCTYWSHQGGRVWCPLLGYVTEIKITYSDWWNLEYDNHHGNITLTNILPRPPSHIEYSQAWDHDEQYLEKPTIKHYNAHCKLKCLQNVNDHQLTVIVQHLGAIWRT